MEYYAGIISILLVLAVINSGRSGGSRYLRVSIGFWCLVPILGRVFGWW